MPKRSILTLLTDFGLADSYVGQMKGVILSIRPAAMIIDITHQIPPGNVLAGALALRQALPYFPEGTVHCAVIDPGVGTERRILAGQFSGQTVICPDNGLITFIERDLPLQEIVIVRNQRYYREGPISTTFHGRDIMAAVAAHVAGGLPLGSLGPQPERFKLLSVPEPQMGRDLSVTGEIIHVDGFGNLISNIRQDVLVRALGRPLGAQVICAGREAGRVAATYAAVEPGEPLGLVNSAGLLEVAVNAGRACDVLNAKAGSEVIVRPEPLTANR